MKRMVGMLAVVAMMVMMAMPAFAAGQGGGECACRQNASEAGCHGSASFRAPPSQTDAQP